MKYLFIDSSPDIGGIESFIIETSNYLATNNYDITLITYGKKNIYINSNLNKNVKIIHYRDKIDGNLSSIKELNKFKGYVRSNISFDEFEEVRVMAPYFKNLQLASFLFSDSENVKILHLWGHPEDWIRTLSIVKKNEFSQRKYKNKLYYYQRKLLNILSDNNGDFYGGEVVSVYNSWYYDVNLKYKEGMVYPITDISSSVMRSRKKIENKDIKILWCGRFDYWKNEAIIHSWKEMEKISAKFNIHLTYDIIGYGNDVNTKYVKDNINPINVKVNYIGKYPVSKLSEKMSKYDIGIGMGLSVKKMAQVGLASIVIDSVDKKNIEFLKANWLFKTVNGDAGDGYYFIKAGKEIGNRERLYSLLEKVVMDSYLLEEYSQKSLEYVLENYSQEKQIKSLIKHANNSKVTGKHIRLYRYPYYLRIAYKYKNLINNMKEGS